MMNGRLDRTLGWTAAGVGVGLVVLAISTVAIYLSPGLRTRLGFIQGSTAYMVGQQVDVPASTYVNSRLTVLIFGRSNCPICQAAKPTLRRIALAAGRSPGSGAKIISTIDVPTVGEIRYAAEMGLDAAAVVQVARGSIRARMVPSIVLVDSRGKIVYVSEGSPTTDDEAALLRLFSS